MNYVLKSCMKLTGMVFCSCLRYELLHMLDRLGLMSIFYHVTFCGKTCQLICQFCSRVLYENSDPNEKCRRMFKDVKLKDACNRDITAMFHSLKTMVL